MKSKKKSEGKKMRLLPICGLILGSIIFLTLFLYFITSYNSTVLYSYSFNSDKFTLSEGLILKSKMYNILTFGDLKMNNSDIDSFYVELYISDRLIVGSQTKSLHREKVIEYYGYEEYFTKELFDKLENEFKIKIYVPKEEYPNVSCGSNKEKCDSYEYQLVVREEFRNNKLIYLKGNHI
ncbi:MAG: hypothetical protein IJN13_02260 [Bacilli bacterium]|nr:hypothetical protein [Bacilli bacterium]